MKKTERKIKKLLRRSSPWRLIVSVLMLLTIFPITYVVRNYVFESILLKDSSLFSDAEKGEWLFFCKWKSCKENLKPNDFVLVELPNGKEIVRKLIALPGDSLKLSSAGFIQSSIAKHHFKEETIIIDDRIITLPQKGDTLFFNKLNDIETDYTLNLLRQEKIPFFVKALPYSGKDSLPLALAGNTKIGARPVSTREVQGLPWQELHLIANQIQMQIHSTDPIEFKRQIFNAKDSTLIEYFIVPENMYYVLCLQGKYCADSRELGYISKSQIIGKLIYP